MKNRVKGTWGGARKKKTPKKEATVVKRIPISKLEAVNLLLGKNDSN
jgi:hypothetical protein